MIYTPTRIALPDTSNFKRVPPRDPEDRQENYLERFDFTTVFSDVFVQDGRVWMVGPPFLNLERELKGSTFEWDAEDVSTRVEFENFKRMSRASFPVDSTNGLLKIVGPLGNWEIDVSSAPDFAFAGSNLLVTQQQDNRLEWIAYWALFNVQVNGVDSIVVYDNLSELYSSHRIDQVLSRVPGLKHHIVVNWDTPYGTTGGPNSKWDSDYGQHISWEHARRAFGGKAKSVCIIDVDELPITMSGKTLVEELLSSGKAVLPFNRQPIRRYSNRAESGSDLRVHRDFSLGESRGAWLSPKYIYSPTRLPEKAHLLVHVVHGLEEKWEPSTNVFAGHFDAIRVPWRAGRKQPIGLYENLDTIKETVEEVEELNRAFDDLETQWEELLHKIRWILDEQSAK